jgi:hypothetical protein
VNARITSVSITDHAVTLTIVITGPPGTGTPMLCEDCGTWGGHHEHWCPAEPYVRIAA